MNNDFIIELLQKEKELLLSKIDKIDNTLSSLMGVDTILSSINGYSSTSTALSKVKDDKYKGFANLKNRQKVALILKNEGRFMHMREIIRVAQSLEPKIDPKQISTAIYTMKNLEDSPLVNKSIDGMNTNTFWGSKKWLDESGNIKSEHMYNESEIKKTKIIDI